MLSSSASIADSAMVRQISWLTDSLTNSEIRGKPIVLSKVMEGLAVESVLSPSRKKDDIVASMTIVKAKKLRKLKGITRILSSYGSCWAEKR